MNILNKHFINKNYIVITICGVIILSVFITTLTMAITYDNKSSSNRLVIKELKKTYGGPILLGNNILSKEEFSALEGETQFKTYEDYVTTVTTSFNNSGITLTATGANLELYNMCDLYFNCFHGSNRVSPIFPLALANVETPGRADNSITWSALFPSKFVDVSHINTFCVTDVLENKEIYSALSKEYSTRDRGALQMSPTYGTNNKMLNSRMSGTEKDKLKKINIAGYEHWVSGASNNPGDRFYIPDILLRLQAAMQYNIDNMYKNNYIPETDMQLIAMLAIGHNTGSGIWYYSDHNKPVGNWLSGEHCLILCKNLGSVQFISELTDYARQSKLTHIDTNVARSLYSKVFNEDVTKYTSSVTNGTFGIKALYAYIKLSLLYTE